LLGPGKPPDFGDREHGDLHVIFSRICRAFLCCSLLILRWLPAALRVPSSTAFFSVALSPW
jgi:hypothetical protein